jgi:hypothetical protein
MLAMVSNETVLLNNTAGFQPHVHRVQSLLLGGPVSGAEGGEMRRRRGRSETGCEWGEQGAMEGDASALVSF